MCWATGELCFLMTAQTPPATKHIMQTKEPPILRVHVVVEPVFAGLHFFHGF
jgi:hypothetical protein